MDWKVDGTYNLFTPFQEGESRKKVEALQKVLQKIEGKCKFTLENLDYISLDVLINKMEESFHNIYIYQFIMMYILNIILSVIP